MSFDGCSERFANATSYARRTWFNASRFGRSFVAHLGLRDPRHGPCGDHFDAEVDSELGMKNPHSFVSFKPLVHQSLIPNCPHL